MTNPTQRVIDLRYSAIKTIPMETFNAIIDRVKKEKARSKVLANDFNYPLTTINMIRSYAISMGILERPPGVVKMMESVKRKKELGISRKRTVVNKNINITTSSDKESFPTSKFVNIKFGEIEVVVEKSANIIITKDKIVIN